MSGFQVYPTTFGLTAIVNVATDRLAGRDTAGTGALEEITVGGGIEFTGSGGIQTSAFTGDVTKTAGGTATTIANNAVSDAKLRDSAALSVIGRSANSSGDPADIAGTDGQVLRVSGTTLGFGTVATAGIADDAVTYAKIQDVSATDKILGRVSASAGVIEEVTFTDQAQALCDDTTFAAMCTTLGLGTGDTVQHAGLGIGQAGAANQVIVKAAGVTSGTHDQLLLVSQSVAIVTGNLIGGVEYLSRDNNLGADTLVAYLRAEADGTHTATSLPTRVVCGVTPSATTTPIEAWRARNTGEVQTNKSHLLATEVDNGNSSTADTIDWTQGNLQKSTLTGNCTYTFTAPSGPARLVLRLIQDGSGSRTVTWPAAVHWPSATAPTLTTTAAKIDIVTFVYDGSVYWGSTVGLNYTA